MRQVKATSFESAELVLINKSPDLKRFTDLSSPPIPISALRIANGDFLHMSLFGRDEIKNRVFLAISSMLRLGKTRPLPGHSSIGSISMRKHLRSGMPPPTTESNKGRSVPVIWQKTRHGAYLQYTQNTILQHQSEDSTGKPDTPYLQH
ncbi:hypothetical protein TNCV_3319241 [Trichonephila clavipes]|nr:hypothetical protein TNCV_3319241 [Trichonephila clavipes]